MSVKSTKVVVAIENFNNVLENDILSNRDTFIDRNTKRIGLKVISLLNKVSDQLVDNRTSEKQWEELRNRKF